MVFSIDIGGTFIKLGFVNRAGEIIDSNEIKTRNTKDDIFDDIFEFFNNSALKVDTKAITISLPGAIDSLTYFVDGEIAVKCLEQSNIKDIVLKYSSLPLFVENDANCAALAELWQGELKDTNVGILYVIGTGIGGAVTFNGQLLKTKRNFAGEFGYQTFDNEFDVSQNCSAKAIERYYFKKTQIDKTAKEIFECDSIDAINAINYWSHLNALALFNLTYVLDPDKIILAGGVTQNDKLEENFNNEFAKIAKKHNKEYLKPLIKSSQYKNYANVIGAASMYHNIERNKKWN